MSTTPIVLESGEFRLDQICDVAGKIAQRLVSEESFCLWMYGDLGAGKTTLVRHLLYELGLAAGYPVPSPTFAYMYEYRAAGEWYAHLDLYRGENLNLEDLGIVGYREYRGYFVEWPEKMAEGELMPSHKLRLFHVSEQVRAFEFEKS